MPKKKELTDIFQERKKTQQNTTEAQQPVASKRKDQNLPPSRRGKRNVTGWFDPEVHRQLRLIAADEDKSLEQVLADAINTFFEKRGIPPIA